MNKVLLKPYSISRIHWMDTNAIEGWHDPSGLDMSGLEVHSVGFLIHEDDKTVTLAKSVSGSQVGDLLNIVKSGIVDRWDL